MSKARLVITAVTVEGLSQGEAARRYGVSQGWISRLLARYRAEGEAAFDRCHTKVLPLHPKPRDFQAIRSTPVTRTAGFAIMAGWGSR